MNQRGDVRTQTNYHPAPRPGGPAGAQGDPMGYAALRRLYRDVDVLTGPDGPFPVGVVPLAPAVRRDLESLLGTVGPAPAAPRVHDRRVIDAVRAGDPGVWDGTTFSLSQLTLTADGEARRLDAYLGSYFDMVSSAGLLEHELREAVKHGDEATIDPGLLPQRRSTLRSHPSTLAALCAGGGVDAALGISTLVVHRRSGAWWLLCEARSKTVAGQGDLFHVVPALIFQPVVPPTPANLAVEWSIRHNIVREYLEELFGVPEVRDGGPSLAPDYFADDPNLLFLQELLDAGAASLHGIAFAFNLLSHRPEICTLLLIEDERWSPTEAAVIAHRLDDPAWASVARPWTMVPPGAAALILGTREACRLLDLPEPDWLRPFAVEAGA